MRGGENACDGSRSSTAGGRPHGLPRRPWIRNRTWCFFACGDKAWYEVVDAGMRRFPTCGPCIKLAVAGHDRAFVEELPRKASPRPRGRAYVVIAEAARGWPCFLTNDRDRPMRFATIAGALGAARGTAWARKYPWWIVPLSPLGLVRVGGAGGRK